MPFFVCVAGLLLLDVQTGITGYLLGAGHLVKAKRLCGDSDTLACITGGIAEAFYKEIPKAMADRVYLHFPKIFHKILDAVREETVYGKTCRIV
jgi:hypothetical protein